MRKADFALANEILLASAFLHHLDGPILFQGGAMEVDSDDEFMKVNMSHHTALPDAEDEDADEDGDGDEE